MSDPKITRAWIDEQLATTERITPALAYRDPSNDTAADAAFDLAVRDDYPAALRALARVMDECQGGEDRPYNYDENG